jgi:hypothetical protein
MAAWRRRAIEAVPEFRREISDPRESIYTVWFELLAYTRQAHERDDRAVLARIYAFADWCLFRSSPAVRNAVAVSFYEHLLDAPEARRLVLPWLSDRVIAEVMPLWEARLPAADLMDVSTLIRARR